MTIPHPLPDDLAELVAQRFRVIGEPMRIRLLDQLRDGERSVGDLVEALGATQQNVSKHLGVLYQAGIVGRRKDGNRVIYAIADDSVFALCETVCGGLARHVAEIAQLLEAPPASGSARR
jgi:DNA-binding transcriptional ArsR family regulator